jgi:hypothetical protein
MDQDEVYSERFNSVSVLAELVAIQFWRLGGFA